MAMKLEDQVCILELAKLLKELGVRQESLFYYSRINVSGKYELDFGIRGPWETVDTEHAISAFTVAELGEMMFRHPSISLPEYDGVKWTWAEWHGGGMCTTHSLPLELETEADARAKMLIYLIEHKPITI